MIRGMQAPVNIIIPLADAEQIVRQVQEGTYRVRGQDRIGGVTIDGVRWSVEVADIAACYTFTVDVPDQPPPGQTNVPHLMGGRR